MEEIKLRGAELKHESNTNRVIGAAERAKELARRTADQTKNLFDDEQTSFSAYAGDQLQYGMEGIAIEAGHIVVGAGKTAYRAGKTAIRKHQIKREDTDPEKSKPENTDPEHEEQKDLLREKANAEGPHNGSLPKNRKAEQPSKTQGGRTVKGHD